EGRRRQFAALVARAPRRQSGEHRRPIPRHHKAVRRCRRQRDGAAVVDRVRADDWIPMVWSQGAVMDMQARLDPVRMTGYADDWQACVDAIRDVLVELNRQVAAQLDASWRGLGADGASAALQRYVAGSVDGLVASRSVAVHLYELSRAAGNLRACITPPSDDLGGQRL